MWKKVRIASSIIMIIAMLFLALNRFFLPLGDWAVRLAGIVVLADLFILVLSSVEDFQSKQPDA